MSGNKEGQVMAESAISIIEKETATEVAISGAMTIEQIDQVRVGLLEAFNLGKSVQVSLAAVTDVDLTGLQLLCSAHRTAMAREQDFSVSSGGCQALSSVAKVAGMLRHIGCPQDICGTCVWKSPAVDGKGPL